MSASRAEICAVACAEAWRGDGEILASAMGTMPSLGAQLARATFSPDLLLSDGQAYLMASPTVVEGWVPFRTVFDLLWAGRRHVMMGATQVDRHGNQNIACIGDWAKPKAQLLGVRGAPGNTANHATSYWVPNHSPRVFVDAVDMVSGLGYRRAAEAGSWIARHHEIRRIVSNLGVFDFETPGRTMRLRSVHPGVTIDDVVAATGFALEMTGDVDTTREPSAEELRLIREVLDPDALRNTELKE